MRSFSSGASMFGGVQNTVSRRPGSSPSGSSAGAQCGALLATRPNGSARSSAPFYRCAPPSKQTSSGAQPNCFATMRASLSRILFRRKIHQRITSLDLGTVGPFEGPHLTRQRRSHFDLADVAHQRPSVDVFAASDGSATGRRMGR